MRWRVKTNRTLDSKKVERSVKPSKTNSLLGTNHKSLKQTSPFQPGEVGKNLGEAKSTSLSPWKRRLGEPNETRFRPWNETNSVKPSQIYSNIILPLLVSWMNAVVSSWLTTRKFSDLPLSCSGAIILTHDLACFSFARFLFFSLLREFCGVFFLPPLLKFLLFFVASGLYLHLLCSVCFSYSKYFMSLSVNSIWSY